MKAFKYFLLLLIAIVFASINSPSLYAQSLQGKALADSIINELPKTKSDTNQVKLIIKIVKALISTDPPTAMYYADTAMQLAQKYKWNKGIGMAYINKAPQYPHCQMQAFF